MISTIKYKNIELDVHGMYHKSIPGGNYDTQPMGECFEIEKISYRDTDVTDLLDSLAVDFADIEQIVLEQVKD